MSIFVSFMTFCESKNKTAAYQKPEAFINLIQISIMRLSYFNDSLNQQK